MKSLLKIRIKVQGVRDHLTSQILSLNKYMFLKLNVVRTLTKYKSFGGENKTGTTTFKIYLKYLGKLKVSVPLTFGSVV